MKVVRVGRAAPMSPRVMVFTTRFWFIVQWGWWRWNFHRYGTVAKWGWSFGPFCVIREL